jgi:hypothetical protein
MIPHQMAFVDLAFPVTCQLFENITHVFPQIAVRNLFPILRNPNQMVQSHVVWLKLLLLFIESLLEVSFGRFTDWRLSYILPELSNSGSLPSKAGGLPGIIRVNKDHLGLAQKQLSRFRAQVWVRFGRAD